MASTFISPIDIGITFKLHKLLHVLSISKNLLSVSQYAKDNWSLNFILSLTFTQFIDKGFSSVRKKEKGLESQFHCLCVRQICLSADIIL